MENLLISCTVVSYNSSKTILETLESIKAQTYQNIELIVSDDGSKDDTVDICRRWIKDNGSRFVRAELLTVKKNTGIVENCNRAWKACNGVWKKGCAADDKLLPNCIEDYMNFVHDNPEARWIASEIRMYRDTFEEENCMSTHFVSTRFLFDLTAKEQLRQLSKGNTIPAASLFCQLSLIRELGGYDTEYSFEDYPFNVKALENGYKCYFMDKETVAYRFHDSTSQSKDELFHTGLLYECRRFQRENCFKYLTEKQVRGIKYNWKIQDVLMKLGLNKRKPIVSQLYYASLNIISKMYNLS